MQFRVLGALGIVGAGGEVVHIGSRVRRALLAVLLLRANEPVASDDLCAALWPDKPPVRAREGLRVHVHQLRRHVDRERLIHGPAGYRLVVEPGELDAQVFLRLVEEARTLETSMDRRAARDLLRRALSLWRGSAFAGLDEQEPVRGEAAMLNDKRLGAYEECFEVELALGLHSEICAELRALAGEHPFRERLRGQGMLALYRSDRQAEALAAFEETRRLLADELGVDPGRQLRDLHERILRDDPTLLHRAETPAVEAKSVDTPTKPSQLPAAPASFTGRQSYLDTLNRIVEAGEATGAVVITALAGMAGIGKTALATYWAHQARDRFPDGQLYVNLRGYAPTPQVRPLDALGQFLRALEVPADRIPIDVDEAAGLYRTMLNGRRMLLLLDNARSADQVRPLLPGGPGCLALVTSRDKLSGLIAHDGAVRVALDVLDPDEAVALLRKVIGAEVVDHEPDAVAALAAACGYLPLALRIAAANLGDGLHPNIAGYLAALRRDGSLGALEVENDSVSSVRAAFLLSYEDLSPETARLFRRMSVSPGPDLSTDAVAAITGSGLDHTARELERLSRAHLVDQHAPDRWAMHDLIRAFAAERAQSEEIEQDLLDARDRLFGYYLARSDAAARVLYPHLIRVSVSHAHAAGFAGSAQASAWLDVERQNLLTAITSGATEGPYDATWRLADTLRGYFYLRSNHLAWLTSARAALSAAKTAGSVEGEAAANLSLGTELWDRGAYREAASCFERIIPIFRDLRQLGGLASSLGNLGLVCWERGDLRRAVHQYEEALPLHRAAGSRLSESIVLGTLAEARHALGQTELAREHLARALDLSDELGDRAAIADHHRCLAMIHRDSADLAEALRTAEHALSLAREANHKRYEVNALNVLASVRLRLGRSREALDDYGEAEALAAASGFAYPQLMAQIGIAHALTSRGDHSRARHTAERAVARARVGGRRILETEALVALALALLDMDEVTSAVDAGRQAQALADATGYALGRIAARAVLTRAAPA